MVCFRFIPDEACQYDPFQLISKKKKKQRRGNYEHQETPEMMQLANKLTLHTDLDRETEMMDLITTPNPSTDPKEKRKTSLIPFPVVTSTSPSPKKLKVCNDPFLQIVDYPTPTMENDAGKKIDNEKTLIQHYSSLKLQAIQERYVIEEEVRSTQSPQLISALDRKI